MLIDVLGSGSFLHASVCHKLSNNISTCIRRKKKSTLQQTDPPSIPVKEFFPNGEFPEGEIQQYKDE